MQMTSTITGLYSIDINTEADFNKLESQLTSSLRRRNLGDVLHSLWILQNKSTHIQPFMVAGLAMLAMQSCRASNAKKAIKPFNIIPLLQQSNSFFLADPITFSNELLNEFNKSNPVFMVLRMASQQFPCSSGIFSDFARPFYLYDEIPSKIQGRNGVPSFDFESTFQQLHGISVLDFIATGFLIWAATKRHFSINVEFFLRSRRSGLNLPDQKTVNRILDLLSADKTKFLCLKQKMQSSDRRFRMYDFNPLFRYPLIKPYQGNGFTNHEKDFFHAPLPDLIASRISTGIFYDMYNTHSRGNGNVFAEFFGHVFENYVGCILQHCIAAGNLLSESEIRRHYSSEKGKAPDWIFAEDTALVLVECKATRFSRAAKAIATEETINNNLAQVSKGLKQLACFKTACHSSIQELTQFHKYSSIRPVLVTLEPMHLINTPLFRKHIDQRLEAEGIPAVDWQILSIDELEAIQPHIAAGIKLSHVLESLKAKSFNTIIEELSANTHRSFKDSFLYSKQEELYNRLGLHSLTGLEF